MSGAARTARRDIMLQAAGILDQTCPWPEARSNQTAPASGQLIGLLIGLRAGDVVGNISCWCAAAGSGLTLVKLGLFAIDGTLLASSADVKANFAGTGMKTTAMAAPYTVTADGGYYLGFLATNSAGSNPQLDRCVSFAAGAVGSGARKHVQQTGRTDMPSPATWSLGDGNFYWLAASA